MAHQATETEFTLDTAAALASEERAATIRGRSPWYLATTASHLHREKVVGGAVPGTPDCSTSDFYLWQIVA